MSGEDVSIRGGYTFPNYASTDPNDGSSSLGDDISVGEHPYDAPATCALSKIQQRLRYYSEESSWPSFTIPPRSNSPPSHQQNLFCRLRKHACILRILIGVVLAVSSLHLLSLFPTAEERRVAEHYYGDSAVYNLPGSTLKMRNAQNTADQAFGPMQRSLRKHGRHSKDRDHPTTFLSTDDTTNTSMTTTPGCESTILLLRHCEKGSVAEHCAYDGFERSVYLAHSVFGHRWPYPAAIFVENPGRRHNRLRLNFREMETIGPLVATLRNRTSSAVHVDDSYSNDNIRDLTQGLLTALQQGVWCGQVVVLVWKHSRIAHLARLLGCGPMQGCPLDYHGKTFDQVWELKFVYREWPHSERKHHFGGNGGPSWKVFGSVQEERFDPLEVSFRYGDYPEGGTDAGGRWRKHMRDFPERKNSYDTAGWKATHVDLGAKNTTE